MMRYILYSKQVPQRVRLNSLGQPNPSPHTPWQPCHTCKPCRDSWTNFAPKTPNVSQPEDDYSVASNVYNAYATVTSELFIGKTVSWNSTNSSIHASNGSWIAFPDGRRGITAAPDEGILVAPDECIISVGSVTVELCHMKKGSHWLALDQKPGDDQIGHSQRIKITSQEINFDPSDQVPDDVASLHPQSQVDVHNSETYQDWVSPDLEVIEVIEALNQLSLPFF